MEVFARWVGTVQITVFLQKKALDFQGVTDRSFNFSISLSKVLTKKLFEFGFWNLLLVIFSSIKAQKPEFSRS